MIVTLTNGYQSPILGLSQKRQRGRLTVSFDHESPKLVQTLKEVHNSHLAGLSFHDKQGRQLGEYNPKARKWYQKLHQLKDCEEIIGVYGYVSDEERRITHIAFIVKTPKQVK